MAPVVEMGEPAIIELAVEPVAIGGTPPEEDLEDAIEDTPAI